MTAPLLVAASAPGLGGIGVLLVVGDGAADLVDRVLRPAGVRSRPLRHGWLHDDRGPVEEVLCRWLPPAASPFGCEAVEIDAHGGPVSLERCGGALAAAGAMRASADELLARLPAERGWDDLRRDALRCLLGARTRLAAAMLLDQARGALSAALAALRARPDPAAARALRAGAATGIALVSPRRVALVGPPNAGKSTLFNRLAGSERALVHETPGTTRDPVAHEIALSGIPLLLTDTAGVRDAEHTVERLGIEEARRTAAEADLLVHVRDSSRPEATADLPTRPGTPGVEVWNKSDLVPRTSSRLSCSALTGAGIDRVAEAILAALQVDPARVAPGEPMIFRAGQLALVP